MPIPDTPTIDQARAIAAAGLRVLPIKPGRKNPPMASWQNAASVEEKAINAWWNGLYRDHGIGIAMGPQPDGRNVFAIDIDTHDEDANGYDTLSELEAVHGELPATVTSITGSGGSHQIYAAPADAVIRNQQSSGQRIGPGIDVRGDGGQIVVAPTVHPDTKRTYRWQAGRAPWEHAIADAPQWLLDMVVERAAPAAPPARPVLDGARTSSVSAADILRERWHWPTELAATGWTEGRTEPNGDTYYTRPGKDARQGHSAVLHGTDGPFVVFTTDISPEMRSLGHLTRNNVGYAFSPLEWDAAVRHGGDLSAASRAVLGVRVAQMASRAPESVDDGVEQPEDYDGLLRGMLVNWPEFWSVDHNDAEWLAEPIVAAKRSTAIFAPGGTGKSLLALYIAACLATGRTLFGRRTEETDVLYLDYEMTADDLSERLQTMGFGEDVDMSRLHYALLPSLPGLDEPEGGKAVVRLAELCNAALVVIDTFGRAVHGDENDADTVRSWYRWTGIHLKHAGRAFVRVDHAGKDVTKGQRGTSAKNDDVDVVWQMAAKDAGAFTLTAKKRRMGWVPISVELMMLEDDRLHFELLGGHAWPAGTAEMAVVLDDLGVDVNISGDKAAKQLREAGHGARTAIVRSAQKYRKEAAQIAGFRAPDPVDNAPESASQKSGRTPSESARDALRDAPSDESAKPLLDGSGRTAGRSGTHIDDATGTQCVTRRGTHAPSVDSEPSEEPATSDTIAPFDIF